MYTANSSRYVSNRRACLQLISRRDGSTIPPSGETFDAQEHGEMMYSFTRPKGQRQRDTKRCVLTGGRARSPCFSLLLLQRAKESSSLSQHATSILAECIFRETHALDSPRTAPEVCCVHRWDKTQHIILIYTLIFRFRWRGRRFLSWEAQQDETDRFKGFITAKPSAPAHAAACRRFGRHGPSPIEKCVQNAATTVRLHAQPSEQNSDLKRDTSHFQFLNRANLKLWERRCLWEPFSAMDCISLSPTTEILK